MATLSKDNFVLPKNGKKATKFLMILDSNQQMPYLLQTFKNVLSISITYLPTEIKTIRLLKNVKAALKTQS